MHYNHENFEKARIHLGYKSKRGLAKLIGIDNVTILQVETGTAKMPNPIYLKFLVDQGINLYYLFGYSDQMFQKDFTPDVVSKSEYEKLKNEIFDLKQRLKEFEAFLALKNKFEPEGTSQKPSTQTRAIGRRLFKPKEKSGKQSRDKGTALDTPPRQATMY